MKSRDKLTILLVDDDPTTNFLHQRTLKRTFSDIMVFESLDGKSALERLREDQRDGFAAPHVIFLDINMPVLDGWGFLRGYRELDPKWRANTELYILTTSLNPDDHRRADDIVEVAGVFDKILTADRIEPFRLRWAELKTGELQGEYAE